jgi:hypothetical protein
VIRSVLARVRANLVVFAMGALFSAGLIGGAAVVSAHGGDESLIHACVKGSKGDVRIVGATSGCLPSEKALDWSIAGPQGPTGPAGATGPAGILGVYAIANGVLHDPDGNGIGDYFMFCDAGDKATGGGYVPEGTDENSVVYQSKHVGSLANPVGWLILAKGIHEAYAYCADFPPLHS